MDFIQLGVQRNKFTQLTFINDKILAIWNIFHIFATNLIINF